MLNLPFVVRAELLGEAPCRSVRASGYRLAHHLFKSVAETLRKLPDWDAKLGGS